MIVELTERQESILTFVVRQYIQHGQPIGSRAVREKSNVNVSSATIRNEMATLEKAKLLIQPHTSAGRIPTESGYRYFVQRLMKWGTLAEAEQQLIRHQFHQARLDIEQWMKLTAAVLAHKTNSASVVTIPQSNRCRIKHIELIGISDGLVLLVLVLQGGIVKQQLVRTTSSMLTQEEFTLYSNKLNAYFQGLDRYDIMAHPSAFTFFEARVREAVVQIMENIDERSASQLYRDGLMHVLRRPEFSEVAAIRQIISILEQGSLLEKITAEIRHASGVQVIIGGEGRWEEISDVSLVMAPYGVGDTAGVMGVVGPMRMSYGRAISAVHFMAKLMNHLLADLYLNQEGIAVR